MRSNRRVGVNALTPTRPATLADSPLRGRYNRFTNMLSFILKRVRRHHPVMGVVALTVFLLLRLSPGDPAP